MRWETKQRLAEAGKIGLVSFAVLGILGALGFMTYDMIQGQNQLNEAIEDVGAQLVEKVSMDLESTEIPLRDGYVVDISHISLDNKREVGEPTNELNVYGVVDNQYAFKNSYELSAEQVSYLTEKRDQLTAITRLGELIEEMQLTKHDFTDLKAMSLGLMNEKQMEQFAKIMGPAVPTNNFFISDYNETPDAFIPMYSRVNIQEKNGKQYVVMDVEGLDVHEKSNPNIAIGIIYGSGMYNATGNLATSYAFGLSMAYMTAIEECDTYVRTDRIVAEIGPEQANMTTDELRDWLVQGMLNKTVTYEKENLSFSENLYYHRINQAYNKLVEKEQ